MKKLIIFVSVIVVMVVGAFFFLQNVNINRLGTDNYYVQIIGKGEKFESKANNGEKFVHYEYTLPGFNEDGVEKEFTFTSSKQLREEAYLNLFVKDEEVKSYKEVKLGDISSAAQEKLK